MEGLLVGANLHLRIHIISLTAIHGACKRDANIPGSARALACYDWRPRQSAGRDSNIKSGGWYAFGGLPRGRGKQHARRVRSPETVTAALARRFSSESNR